MPDDHRPNHVIGSASLPPPTGPSSPLGRRVLQALANDKARQAHSHPDGLWDALDLIPTHDDIDGRVIADRLAWSPEEIEIIIDRSPAGPADVDLMLEAVDQMLEEDNEENYELLDSLLNIESPEGSAAPAETGAADILIANLNIPEADKQRLGELVNLIRSDWGPYKKDAWKRKWRRCRWGEWFTEAKEKAGHGSFGPLLRAIPFVQSTAENYMNEFDDVAGDLKIATLANLTAEAFQAAIEQHAREKAIAWREREAAPARTRPPVIMTRPRREPRHYIHRRSWGAVSYTGDQGGFGNSNFDRPPLQGLPNLRKVWPPQHCGLQGIRLKWTVADGSKIHLYAWLPDYPFGVMDHEAMARDYRWVAIRDGRGECADSKRWEEVEHRIRELHRFSEDLYLCEFWESNPIQIELAEDLVRVVKALMRHNNTPIIDPEPLDPEPSGHQ